MKAENKLIGVNMKIISVKTQLGKSVINVPVGAKVIEVIEDNRGIKIYLEANVNEGSITLNNGIKVTTVTEECNMPEGFFTHNKRVGAITIGIFRYHVYVDTLIA